jgi:signal transduction histidine kinase
MPNITNCVQMLEGCEHSAKSLTNLINDLLDLAKQEQRTFQFYKEYFDLIQTVK